MDKTLNNEVSQSSSKSKFNIMKLLSGKSLKIIILIIVSLVAVIMIMGLDTNDETKVSETISQFKYNSTMEYCEQLESKLERVLSQIKGAGQVSVMLSLEGSPELVYAENSDTKVSSNSNGSTTTNSSTPIIVQTGSISSPLILTENLPIVKGVIIVSSGAENIAIKLDILNAVSTLLDISTEKISVLKGI